MWFSLEPIDLEHARSLPDTFENTALVKAPAARVFDCFVSDMTRWMPDVRSVTWMTPEPHGVGTHRVVRLPGLAVHEKFLAWERGRHVAFRLEAASLPLLRAMVEDLRIEPAGEGLVRVRYSVHYAPLAVARPLSPLLAPVFAKMFEDGLKALGRHAERLQSSNLAEPLAHAARLRRRSATARPISPSPSAAGRGPSLEATRHPQPPLSDSSGV